MQIKTSLGSNFIFSPVLTVIKSFCVGFMSTTFSYLKTHGMPLSAESEQHPDTSPCPLLSSMFVPQEKQC